MDSSLSKVKRILVRLEQRHTQLVHKSTSLLVRKMSVSSTLTVLHTLRVVLTVSTKRLQTMMLWLCRIVRSVPNWQMSSIVKSLRLSKRLLWLPGLSVTVMVLLLSIPLFLAVRLRLLRLRVLVTRSLSQSMRLLRLSVLQTISAMFTLRFLRPTTNTSRSL